MSTLIKDKQGWSTVKLSEVVEFLDHLRKPVTKSDRKEGSYPYYGANGQQGRIDGYIFDEPLVLLAEDGGNFGSRQKPVAYKIEGKTWVNNHAHVLRPKQMIDVNYLHRVLSFYDVMSYVNGATRLKLTKGNASRMPMLLPPLPIQKKIAAILERADQTHRKCQQALLLTDQFLQAAFLKMFGDPVKNPKEWEVRKFGDFIDFVTSGSRGWAKYYSDSGAKFIRVQNLTNHKLNLNDMAFVKPPASLEAERTRVQTNDVLISITGVVGLSAVVPQDISEAYVSQHVALTRLKDNLNPMFASFFISNRLGGQLQFKKFQYGQTKPGLNLNQIRDIRIFIPSLAEQEKFAAIVERVEAFHEKQCESEQELKTLFQSLMQKAFK